MLPSLVFALVLGAGGRWTLVAMLIGLAVVAGAVRYLEWSRFAYGIEGRELVVESGLLQRNRRVVPLDRVQQVDLERKVQHRVFGLAVVRIDTAGGGRDAEVVLDAVSDEEAERLRSLLRSVPPTAPPEVAPAQEVDGEGPERDVVTLRPGLLALGGITGARLLVMLAVVGSFAGFVLEISPDTVERSVDAAREARPTVTTAVLVVLGTLPLWFGAAAASAVLTDGGYRLSRRGDHLHLRRGLLDQRESTLPIHRVQAVRVRQNPVRRALGLVAVTLQSAGGSQVADGSEGNVAIPVLRVGELPRVLSEVLPVAPDAGPLSPAPPAARRRAWVRHLVPTAVLVGGLWVAGLLLTGPSGPVLGVAGAGTLALLALVLASAEQSYAGLGWAATPVLVATRHGGWTRETSLVPVAKAQSTRLASSPFQRRVGLASLAIDVGGRGTTPMVRDADASEMEDLRHRALDSTAARADEAAVRRRAADVAGTQLG